MNQLMPFLYRAISDCIKFNIKFLTATAAFLVIGIIPLPTWAGVIAWDSDVSGNFDDDSKWTGGIAPGSGDTAKFDIGSTGYTVSFTTAQTVNVLKILDDTLIFNLNLNTLNILSDFDLSQGGNDDTDLGIQDGTVNAVDLLTTNSAGLGAESILTIDSGGILNISNLSEIGKNGPGRLFVEGSGSQFTTLDLNVGINSQGDGLLEITDGATGTVNNSSFDAIIGVNSGSFGEIVVSASVETGDTQLDIDGRFVVGGSGSGDLTIGGNTDTAGVDVGGDLIVGFNSGSDGTIEVYDNAILGVAGDLQVGLSGQGIMDIYGGDLPGV